MTVNETISLRQLTTIGVALIYPTLVLLVPGDLIRAAGRWAWLSLPLAGVVIGLVAAAAFRSPVLRKEGVVGATMRMGGPWVGRGVLVAAWLAVAADGTLIVRQVALASLTVYPGGHVSLLILGAMPVILASVIAALGLGVLARVAGIVVPLIIFANVPWIGLSLASIHVNWLLPLVPANLGFASAPAMSVAGAFLVEVFLLAFWTDRLDSVPRARDGSLLPVTVLAIVILFGDMAVAQITGFFGPARAGQFLIPSAELARELAYPDFVQGLDAIASPFLILGGTLKLAFYETTLLRLQRTILPVGAPAWHAAAIALLLGIAGATLLPNAFVLLRALHTFGTLDACVFTVLPLLLILGSVVAPVRRRRTT